MEFTELVSIKTLGEVTCYVDQFSVSPTKPGTVNISSHILCYESPTTNFQIQHTNLHSIECSDDLVTLRCKDFRHVVFNIPNRGEQEKLVETLQNLSAISDIQLTLPFYCRPRSQIEDYLKYDEVQELAWLEIPPAGWTLSNCNDTFQVCEWYGRLLVTPLTDNIDLQLLAECRVENRLPRLTYLYKHKLHGHCVVVGAGALADTNTLHYKLQDKAHREVDVQYMSHMHMSHVKYKRGTLFTAANFKDKLLKRQYKGWDIVHMKIANVSDLTAYLGEMSDKASWLSGNKKWLDVLWDIMSYLHNILHAILEEGHNILIEHYTPVLASLSQICIESRYRTLYGLYAIVYKEWLHAGYKFHTLSSQNLCSEFLLFLSSLRQLLLWYPTSFQYTEDLLIFLHANANSSKYGDFLGDCVKEREELDISSKTIMIWGSIFSEGSRDSFTNPAYRPRTEPIFPVLSAPHTVTGWAEMFCRNAELDVHRARVRHLRWKLHQRATAVLDME